VTARAVVVLDENNKVLHAELVPEIKAGAELRGRAGRIEIKGSGVRIQGSGVERLLPHPFDPVFLAPES